MKKAGFILVLFGFASFLQATTFTVTTNSDSGPGSLRQNILVAGAADIIIFATNLAGATILLTSGELLLNKNLTIDASTLPGGIAINGNHASRIFEVASGKTVGMDSLTITNGLASGDMGGGVLNNGTLTLNRCTVVGNSATSNGGGVRNNSALTLNRCTFYRNSSIAGGGGGIDNDTGPLIANQSTFFANQASSIDGGAIWVGGSLAMTNCTVVGNSAPSGYPGGIAQYLTAPMIIINSILAQNTNGNIGGAFVGANNLTNGDPHLAPFGNYGGPTQTMPPLPGSPAIDSAAAGFTTDQRGYPCPVGLAPDIGAVEGIYNAAGPGVLSGMTNLGNGSFQFGFTNFTGTSFTVLASTNAALPMSKWTILGTPTEALPGQYQFTDLPATNRGQRFYRVTSP